MADSIALTVPPFIHIQPETKKNSRRMTKDTTNEELLWELKCGNKDVFPLIVNRFKSQLFNVVFRFLGNREDAEDVVQDSLIKVFLHIDKYDRAYKASTWIYTITMNLARTNYKKKHRWLILASSLMKDEDSVDVVETAIDYSMSPEFYSDSNFQQEMIEKSLAKVNPIFKEAMILRDIEGLQYEEIGEILGLNLGTVKSRINRGREDFKKILSKEMHK